MIKKCSSCNLFQSEELFRKGRNQCLTCINKVRNERYARQMAAELEAIKCIEQNNLQSISNSIFQKENEGKFNLKEYKAQYYQDNKDIILEQQHIDYLNNREERLKKNKEYYYTNFAASLVSCSKQRAKKDKLIFDLDKIFIENLFNQQNGKCALTDIEFILEPSKNSFRRPFAPSIDRINNYFGYIKTNVRLVCVIVNLSLNEFGDDIFDKMCRAYVEKK